MINIWWSYMMIKWGDHIWWSYTMIIYDDHIWWSSGSHLGAIWEPSGGHLGDIWESFGIHLGAIWGPFGRHLGGWRLKRHLEARSHIMCLALEQNAKVLFKCWFYIVFLRVPSIMAAYLRTDMSPAAADGAGHTSRPLYQDRKNPYSWNCLGNNKLGGCVQWIETISGNALGLVFFPKVTRNHKTCLSNGTGSAN